MTEYNIDELVNEITREVLTILDKKEQTVTSEPGKGLVLVVLSSKTKEEASLSLDLLFRKSDEIRIAMPKDLELVKIPEAAKPINSFDQVQEERLLHKASLVFVPSLTYQDLYSLATFTARSFPLNIILSAWEQGLPVYALREGLQVSEMAGKPLGEILKILEGHGLKIISLRDIEGMSTCKFEPCLALTGECNSCGHCTAKIEESVKRVVQSGASRIGGTLGMPPVEPDMASFIDHTLLKPEATREDVIKLCQEAREHHFASVCVNPSWVGLSSECLKGSDVKVCTVVGFPLGATTTITKVMETRDALANGADEIDMVINVGALKAKQDDLAFRDIQEVREAAGDRILKVILETALLNDDEKIRACLLAKQAEADFVKTSTGFGPGGATIHDVALMRQTVGEEMGVKASGGIRDYETALKMVEAGATRIGASASVAIVKGGSAGESRGKY